MVRHISCPKHSGWLFEKKKLTESEVLGGRGGGGSEKKSVHAPPGVPLLSNNNIRQIFENPIS